MEDGKKKVWLLDPNSYLSVSTSTSFSGINRLLNGWFKALSWRTSQTPLPSCLMLCKATLAVMFLVTDCPFKFRGLLTNGFQGHEVIYVFQMLMAKYLKVDGKTLAILNSSRENFQIIEPQHF